MAMKKFHKRILRDLKICMESDEYQFLIPNQDAQPDEYYMVLEPNQESVYHGQKHVIHIKLAYGNGEDKHCYPQSAPLCTFKTPIWHPNIDTFGSGIICVDSLKHEWGARMTLHNIFSIMTLLFLEPNPNSPQNGAAGRQFVKDRHEFNKKAKEYYEEHNGAAVAEDIIKKYGN